MTLKQPLVSILTPVYNGAKYLRECIGSVLSQSYQNWEYVIINNCSSDNSREIASSYAGKDSRIRVIDNKTFLTSIQNQNNALEIASANSKYCKVLHADDWLYPECIEKMVQLCEGNPNVGVVSSYVISDKRIFGAGCLPIDQSVFPGSEPFRLWLLDNKYVIGNPSSLLIRSEIVRGPTIFYDERYLNADQILCFEALKKHDFGFIHQVLSFMRIHDEQTSAFVTKCSAKALDRLVLLEKCGKEFLTRDELVLLRKKGLAEYYQQIGENIWQVRNDECWSYHAKSLESLGYSSGEAIRKGLLFAFLAPLRNPKKHIKKTLRAIKRHASAVRN